MTLSITLTPNAEAKLREKAAASGEPLDIYAARVLEQVATTSTVDLVLAPFRAEVAASGMSDQDLDSFFDEVRDKAFQERNQRES